MATKAQSTQDHKDFGDAFKEDTAEAAPQTDDQAFGINPEAAQADDGIPNSPEEATEAPSETAAEVTGGEEPGEATAASPMTPADLAKESQRLKSWEGRLKARDAELKAAGSKPASADEAGEDPAEEAGEPATVETGEDEAEKLKGMDPESALKTLSEDFGEDFTKMLIAVITNVVTQATSGTNQSVDEIIKDIVDGKTRAHFEHIVDAHPDFMDVQKSDGFKAYVEALPEEAKAEAVRIIESGSAREINGLLKAYKASIQTDEKPAESSQDTAGLDAAEGVRSSGMRLPAQPGSSSDYSKAWDEA